MKLTLIFGGYFIVCAAAYLYNTLAPGDAPAWFLFLWLPLAILEKPFMPVLKALGLTSTLGPGWFSGDTPALLGHGLVMIFYLAATFLVDRFLLSR